MSEPDQVRLRHMLDASRQAREFVDGRVRSDLDTDPMLLHASVHCLLIVGEAASQLSESCRNQLPGIPWPQIVGMRNRLIHAYFQIDHDIVWDTLSHDLPALITSLEEVVENDD